MAIDITVKDLQALQPGIDPQVAQRLIDGTVARAAALAPCILEDSFPFAEAAQAILVDVILRRVEVGVGVVQSQTDGPFSRTYFPSERALFWPGEIAELQGLCAAATPGAVSSSGVVPVYAMPAPPGDVDLPTIFPGWPGT